MQKKLCGGAARSKSYVQNLICMWSPSCAPPRESGCIMLVWCLLQDDENDSEGSEGDDDDDVDDEDEDDDGDDDMSEVFSDSEGSDSQGEDVEVCLTAKAFCSGGDPQQLMLVEHLLA